MKGFQKNVFIFFSGLILGFVGLGPTFGGRPLTGGRTPPSGRGPGGGRGPGLLRQRAGLAQKHARARRTDPHPARLRNAGQQASQRGSLAPFMNFQTSAQKVSQNAN